MIKRKNLLVVLLFVMFMPLVQVKAVTIDEIVDYLNSAGSDEVKIDAVKTDDAINVTFEHVYSGTTKTKEREYTYTTDGDDIIFEYTPGETNTSEEKEFESGNDTFYYLLLTATLKAKDYTQEEIDAFLGGNTPQTYENYGFIIEDGDSYEYNNETYYKRHFKISIKKANLEGTIPTDDETYLSSVLFELGELLPGTDDEYFEIEEDEDNLKIIINRIVNEYIDQEYSLKYEGNVISYIKEEINNYEEANSTLGHYMLFDMILTYVLKSNGYTIDEIREYIDSNEFDYERNGIEMKELGDSVTFTKEDETVTGFPMSLKIDIGRANLKKEVKETTNPKTNDNIFIYFIVSLISVYSLIKVKKLN